MDVPRRPPRLLAARIMNRRSDPVALSLKPLSLERETTMQHTGTRRTWIGPFLDGMRQQGDPLADACLATLREEHGIEQTNALFKHLDANDDRTPMDAPPALRDFLAATHALPEGTDTTGSRVAPRCT